MNGKTPQFDELYNKYLQIDKQAIMELDENRDNQLSELNELLSEFFSKKIDLLTFKTNIDSITKRKPDVWGFSGFSGLMFFSHLYNTANNMKKLENTLIETIKVPNDIIGAKEKITLLGKYITDIRNSMDDARKAPQFRRIPFFLSFFWQLQDKDKFPTYYSKIIAKLQNLNLIKDKYELEIDDAYEEFNYLMHEFRKYLESTYETKTSLYDVEHIIYHYDKTADKVQKRKAQEPTIEPQILDELVFIGPYFKKLGNLSRSDNKKDIKVFEEKVGKLFSVLGYNVKILGQGTGRNPDGIAFAPREQYCIIYDTKIRASSYSMGTDDRTIIDYINKAKYDYGKNYKKFYYVLISSDFKNNELAKIRKIKKNTAVQSVVLVTIENLLRLLNLKFDGDLDLDYLEENFFLNDGILSEEMLQ